MKKYEATDSRGRVHKRGTKNRIYRYCVVAHELSVEENGKSLYWSPQTSWAGSHGLAVARKKTFVNQGYKDVEILFAEEV